MKEAHAYYDLAVDFQLVERFPEAIEAAEMALTQYSALTDPFSSAPKVLKPFEKLIVDDSSILTLPPLFELELPRVISVGERIVDTL